VPIVKIALGLGFFFQLCTLLAPDRLEYSQVPITQGWWKIQDPRARMQNIMEGCSIIQDRQFPMRLGNIASVIRAVGEGRGITDPALRREFGNFWVVRLGRDLSGWVRGAVILAWLGIVAGAATSPGVHRDKKDCREREGGPFNQIDRQWRSCCEAIFARRKRRLPNTIWLRVAPFTSRNMDI